MNEFDYDQWRERFVKRLMQMGYGREAAEVIYFCREPFDWTQEPERAAEIVEEKT